MTWQPKKGLVILAFILIFIGGFCFGIMSTPSLDAQNYEQKLCDDNNLTIRDWELIDSTGLRLKCCPVDAVCDY